MSMLWAKINNYITKTCDVGLGNNGKLYKSLGFEYIDVERGYDGLWYLKGYAPVKPEPDKNLEEIERLKQELSTYDYIGVKIATGCATIEEYREQIDYCESLRKRIRELRGE